VRELSDLSFGLYAPVSLMVSSAGSTWHSSGTCAMKPREKGGVVDPRLNVYGVKGLKVAGTLELSSSPVFLLIYFIY